jgi:hypothetical protein
MMVNLNLEHEDILAVYAAGPEAVVTFISSLIDENRKIIYL